MARDSRLLKDRPLQTTKPKPVRKRHHYVPEMILRRFTSNGADLYIYSKRDKEPGIRRSKTNNAFVVGHGYSKTDKHGVKTAEQEERFSGSEGRWSAALDAVVAAAKSGSMSSAQALRDDVVEFFYYQWIRTPEFIQGIDGYENFAPLLERYVKEWIEEFRPLTGDEAKSLVGPEAASRLRQNTIVDSLASPMSPEVAAVLRICRFDIVLIGDDQEPFVIGSQPVVTVSRPTSVLLITRPGADLWLPIASRAAIKMVPRSSGLGIQTATERQVRDVNDAMFAQCDAIGGESHEVVESVLVRANARFASA